MNNSITESVNGLYNEELNLYEEIKKFFEINNVPIEMLQAYLQDKFVIDSMSKPPVLQKVLIGAFFSRQILYYTSDIPQSIRLALSSVGSELEWLDVTKLIVLPYMFKNNLPMLIRY